MSPNPITAGFCEKLVFSYGFRVCNSYTPEEQWLTGVEYIKTTNDSQIICMKLDRLLSVNIAHVMTSSAALLVSALCFKENFHNMIKLPYYSYPVNFPLGDFHGLHVSVWDIGIAGSQEILSSSSFHTGPNPNRFTHLSI